MSNENAPENWDTVTGYCFFVKNSRGREFPMLQTFGLTLDDAKARTREMLARRIAYNRSRVDVVSLAQVTLTTDGHLARFSGRGEWQQVREDSLTHPPQGFQELEEANQRLQLRIEDLESVIASLSS